MKPIIKEVIRMILILTILQVIRIALRKLLLLFIPVTNVSTILINTFIFIIYTYILIKYCNKFKIDLKITKVSNKKAYTVLSIIIALLIIINIIINPKDIISIIYSVLVIPIFEELLFRGYVWNRLSKKISKEFVIYIIVTIMFTLWHIGYVDSLILSSKLNNIEFNSMVIVYKMIIGLIFGSLTGYVRYKTKNTYGSIVVHSIMNMVSR